MRPAGAEVGKLKAPDPIPVNRLESTRRVVMRYIRLSLIALLLIVPFTAVSATAHAQVAVGVGVGPDVVAAPYAYGPPDCQWGYYAYYPYACAPYGYYGPDWFAGGLFIGAGPWYHWGFGRGFYGGGGVFGGGRVLFGRVGFVVGGR